MKTRTIRLVRPPMSDEPGVLCITDNRQATYYAFCELPCEIGGRAFAVHRLGLGTMYHVRVGVPTDCSCECMGYLSHGRCKHLQGLLALTAHGLV